MTDETKNGCEGDYCHRRGARDLKPGIFSNLLPHLFVLRCRATNGPIHVGLVSLVHFDGHPIA